MKKARFRKETSTRAIEIARRSKFEEVALGVLATNATMDSLFGDCASARAEARDAGARLDPGVEMAMANVAFALAGCGDIAPAQKIADQLDRRWPSSTRWKTIDSPAVRAMIELKRRDPAKAISLLPSSPLERVQVLRLERASSRSATRTSPEMVNGFSTKDLNQRVIRHFDTKGNQLGSFFPRSSFAGGKWMGLPQGFMVSNKHRIGWYSVYGQQYVEVTFDGKVSSFSGVDAPMSATHVMGMALTDGGDVVVSTVSMKTARSETTRGKVGIFRLNRISDTWVPVSMPSGITQMPRSICGADGDRIVILAGFSAARRR